MPKTAPVTPTPPDEKTTIGKKGTKNASASALEFTLAMMSTVGSKGKLKGWSAIESVPSNVPTNNLRFKLDTVFNAETLLNDVSVLTQWVTIAATAQEVNLICILYRLPALTRTFLL